MKYRTIVADPPWPIQDFPEWADGKGFIETPYPTMSLAEISALPVHDLSDNLDGDANLYLWTIDGLLEEAFGVARSWGFHHVRTIVWCKANIGTGLGGRWPSNVEFVLYCKRPKVVSRPDHLAVTSYLADAAERQGVTRRDVDAYMGTTDMGGWWLSRIEHRCAVPTDEQWDRLREFLDLDDEMTPVVRAINAAKGSYQPKPLARAPSSWFQWQRGKHSQKPEAFLDLVESVSPGPYLELFARRNRLGWDTWGNEALEHVALQGPVT